jgi:hypothetical protein
VSGARIDVALLIPGTVVGVGMIFALYLAAAPLMHWWPHIPSSTTDPPNVRDPLPPGSRKETFEDATGKTIRTLTEERETNPVPPATVAATAYNATVITEDNTAAHLDLRVAAPNVGYVRLLEQRAPGWPLFTAPNVRLTNRSTKTKVILTIDLIAIDSWGKEEVLVHDSLSRAMPRLEELGLTVGAKKKLDRYPTGTIELDPVSSVPVDLGWIAMSALPHDASRDYRTYKLRIKDHISGERVTVDVPTVSPAATVAPRAVTIPHQAKQTNALTVEVTGREVRLQLGREEASRYAVAVPLRITNRTTQDHAMSVKFLFGFLGMYDAVAPTDPRGVIPDFWKSHAQIPNVVPAGPPVECWALDTMPPYNTPGYPVYSFLVKDDTGSLTFDMPSWDGMRA